MYTPEELGQIEAEWAFQLHGRFAFLVIESYQALQDCYEKGIQASRIIEALQPDSAERVGFGKSTFPQILQRLR